MMLKHRGSLCWLSSWKHPEGKAGKSAACAAGAWVESLGTPTFPMGLAVREQGP